MKNKKTANVISWIAQILAVAILGQAAFAKFTGYPETISIFTDIGMEPNGRLLIGVIELIGSLLMLRNSSALYGALLGLGTMGGAIAGHFTQIGWEGDRGILGLQAIGVFCLCAIVLYIHRRDIPMIGRSMK